MVNTAAFINCKKSVNSLFFMTLLNFVWICCNEEDSIGQNEQINNKEGKQYDSMEYGYQY
jgi:hypothetical protein